MCNSNPTYSIKRLPEKKRDKLMTDEEFNLLKSYPNPLVGVVIDLCYLTAQRISDVLKIRMSDITSEGIIIQQKKSKKKMIIAMNPALRKAIQAAKALHSKHVSPMYLLAQSNGKKRSYSAIKDMFDRARKYSGVSGVTIHDIRAKALTDADKIGVNPTKLAGHSNEAQTRTYLRDKTPELVLGLPKKVIKP